MDAIQISGGGRCHYIHVPFPALDVTDETGYLAMEKRVALENFVWRHWCETVSVFAEGFPNRERSQSLPLVMKLE